MMEGYLVRVLHELLFLQKDMGIRKKSLLSKKIYLQSFIEHGRTAN